MKFAIVFAAVLAVSAAQFGGFGQQNRALPRPLAPAPPRPVAPSRVASNDQAANILRYDNTVNPDGSYQYAVELDNGIAAQAQGTVRDFGGNPPTAAVVVQGSYSYVTPEGQQVLITYVADENGYQASGDALPTPPPIPEAIARAIASLPVQKK